VLASLLCFAASHAHGAMKSITGPPGRRPKKIVSPSTGTLSTRRSKEFSDYLLGFTVVQDNARNAHGTLWNEDADALVKADPNRFEYVTSPGFWKGIDY
jgi:hypothetical protein